MTATWEVTDDPGAVAGARIAAAIDDVVRRRGRCRFAVPGGRSPGPVLEWLAQHLSPSLTAAIVLTWVDERHLPIDDADADWRALPEPSNLRSTWEHWLSKVAVRPTLVPMAGPGTLPQATARYAEAFAAQLGGLDVVLLGAGEDGHIASLFPGHPALLATGCCVAVPDSPKPPPQRITLTLPVLQDVELAVLVARGSDKAPVLRRALRADASLPLGRYQPRGAWHWVLDPAAASELAPATESP